MTGRSTVRVLAGDVGGTNTRLAVCEVAGNAVQRVTETVAPSQSHGSLEEIVRAFVSGHEADVRVACFGLPGPVRGRKARLTNLPWEVDADALEHALGLEHVVLVNDLVANAHGLAALPSSAFSVVREGVEDPAGNRGLVSAGTGLGHAGLQRVEGRLHPFPTEAGHSDFAPGTEEEFRLQQFLRRKFGKHVSWERAVSGPALASLHEFVLQEAKAPTPAWMQHGDPADDITRHALAGTDELCKRTLDLFMELYGAQAGNFALSVLATGGIYLGGGIAPRLADAIPKSRFVERFDEKGRLREVVAQIPIRIVLDDKAALKGAALHAAQHSRPGRD
jgi:glucokinase